VLTPKVLREILTELLPHYTDLAHFGTFENHTSGPVEKL
jgi:hypothetical protein